MGGGGMARAACIDDTWKFGSDDETLFKLIEGRDRRADACRRSATRCPTTTVEDHRLRPVPCTPETRARSTGNMLGRRGSTTSRRRSSFPGPGLRKGVRAQGSGPARRNRRPHDECALATGGIDDYGQIFMVGESLVGDGNEVAHIDLIIGSKPARPAPPSATPHEQQDGFTTLLAVVAPNLPAKPDTVISTRSRSRAPSRPCRCSARPRPPWRERSSTASPTAPSRGKRGRLLVIVGVFIHWQAEDDKKIYDYNYRDQGVDQRAMKGQPTVHAVVAEKDTASTPSRRRAVASPRRRTPRSAPRDRAGPSPALAELSDAAGDAHPSIAGPVRRRPSAGSAVPSESLPTERVALPGDELTIRHAPLNGRRDRRHLRRAFPMTAARLIVTAETAGWARPAPASPPATPRPSSAATPRPASSASCRPTRRPTAGPASACCSSPSAATPCRRPWSTASASAS